MREQNLMARIHLQQPVATENDGDDEEYDLAMRHTLNSNSVHPSMELHELSPYEFLRYLMIANEFMIKENIEISHPIKNISMYLTQCLLKGIDTPTWGYMIDRMQDTRSIIAYDPIFATQVMRAKATMMMDESSLMLLFKCVGMYIYNCTQKQVKKYISSDTWSSVVIGS